MTPFKLTSAAAAAAALILAAGAAQASVTVFNTASAFDAATTGAVTMGFDGVAESQWYSTFPAGVTVGSATFNAPDRIPGNAGTKGTLFVFDSAYNGNPYVDTSALSSQGLGGANAILDITLSPTTHAIGFDVGDYTKLNATTDILVNGVDVTSLLLPGFLPPHGTPFATEFVGFVSSDAITSIEFRNTDSAAIDVLDFTTAAPAAVPEPAEWALLTLGFGLLGGLLRAKRTAPSAA